MQAFMQTWVGQVVLLLAVGCVGFGWVWWVIHGEISATLMEGFAVALLSAGGVHFIHTQKTNGSSAGTGGAGGTGGPGAPGGPGGAGGAGGPGGLSA